MKNPLDASVYTKRTVPKTHPVRGEFFRDQTAIIHSLPFRRLKHKTQVFFSPENDHVCTRIEHVLHVATIAATICKGLNQSGWDLNPDMAYAIGLGHDIGHTPFGHAGEAVLNQKLKSDVKFMHEVNSYRVVEYLANDGKGMNLTYGVKDGIINHNGEKFEQYLEPGTTINDLENIKDRTHYATSYEGCITRFSDKIAYLGRDVEDAIIAGFISKKKIPDDIKKDLGTTNGQIIDGFVKDLIENSKKQSKVGFSDSMFDKLKALKEFNYHYIYNHRDILHYRKMGENILSELFDYLIELFSDNGYDFKKYSSSRILLDNRFGSYLKTMKKFYSKGNNVPKLIVCDYIAGMTDNFALESIKQITIPSPIKFK